MPESQIVRLAFPMGGRSDKLAYQSQPPFTTVSARNTWPITPSGRHRGGSRPGLARAFETTVNEQIIAMGTLNYVPSESERIRTKLIVVDQLGAIWTADDDATALTFANIIGVSGTHTLTMTERNQKMYIASFDDNQASSSTTSVLVEYDPIENEALPLVATHGLIPEGCTCICTWRDRIVLAGGTTNPYGIFMSRQGDPADWDFSQQGVGAAVSLGLAKAGQIGQPVTSLTSHADDCLLIGCPKSLWVLLGDPTQNGRLSMVTNTVGVVDKHAWCHTPDGGFVFLSADGLYMLPAGCAVEVDPVSLSREKIPTQLLNIDRRNTVAGKLASLEYDIRYRGIHIWVTDRTSTDNDAGNLHFFFDWESKSFWEVKYEVARFDPWVAHARDMTSDESVVMVGSKDGNIRYYLSASDADDNGEDTERPIESHLVFGPVGEEPDMRNDVRWDELDMTLASDSGRMQASFFRGHSAEEAYNSLVEEQEHTVYQLRAGRNPKLYPRVTGSSLFLKISARNAWAYEAGVALLTKLGRTRV